jgi:hypothetical protein
MAEWGKIISDWISQGIRVFIALAIGTSPAIGNKLQAVPFIWPPVGTLTLEADTAAAVVALFGLFPFIIKTKRASRIWVVIGGFATVAALVTYSYLHNRYVVAVPTRHAGIQYRTIGSQRSEECLRKFSSKPNEQVLEIAGLDDGTIERMWTPSSVQRVRLQLFLSYIALLCSLNFALGSLGPFLRRT